MNTPPVQISAKEWRIVQSILRQHVPERTVWCFGSRARRQARPYSDLDLAVISEQPLSLDLLARLGEAFSESDLPWKVDLVDWATVSPSFREIIRKDHVILQPAPAGC